jgi:hypothetical protein
MTKMTRKQLDEDSKRFQEWLTRGPGEVYYGGIIKAAAGNEKRRLNKKLATLNLFPHLEHEDKAALEKAEQAWHEGDRRVKRARARKAAIDDLLNADAGLKITADDLKPPSRT